MSLIDKLKSMFSGGSSDAADAHADHDHAGHDHSHEPVAPPLPQADPAVMPTADAAPSEEGENRVD
jgi:hypothetical protein